MSQSSLNPSMRAVVVDALAPSAKAAGTHETAAINMGKFANIQIIGNVGAFGSGASGTLKFQQSQTSAFTTSKDIDGRLAVDLVESKPAVIDLSQGELDINNGYAFVRGVLTATGGTVTAGLTVQGFDARHAPAEPMTGTVVDTRAS